MPFHNVIVFFLNEISGEPHSLRAYLRSVVVIR